MLVPEDELFEEEFAPIPIVKLVPTRLLWRFLLGLLPGLPIPLPPPLLLLPLPSSATRVLPNKDVGVGLSM